MTQTNHFPENGYTPEEAARYSRHAPQHAYRKRKRRAPKIIAGVAIAAVLVGAGAFGAHQWYVTHPVDIQINGATTTVEGSERTVQGLIDSDTVAPTPGNHLAVDGSVITQGGGKAATVKLNGQTTSDYSTLLSNGDKLEVTNGANTTEDFTETTETTKPAKASVKVQGTGVINLVTPPTKETVQVKTGKESGIQQKTVVKKSSGLTVNKTNADTKGKKLIALTFDDGP